MGKLIYKLNGGHVVEADVKDAKSIFRFMAEMAEIFGDASCGNCQADLTKPGICRPVCRSDKEGNNYYEMRCEACGWSKKFGQRKVDQKLFPKDWEPPYNGGGGQQAQSSNQSPAVEDDLQF